MYSYIICIETLCGKITPAGFGSRYDRRHLEQWRENTNASLLGAGSVRAGDPEFRNRAGKVPANRIRAIVTMSCQLPVEKLVFQNGPRPLIFCNESCSENLSHRLDNRAEIIPTRRLSDKELDLVQVWQELEKRGVSKLLIEGGGKLNYFALKQGLVDEIIITVAPKLLTKGGHISIVDGDEEIGRPFVELNLVSCLTHAGSGEIFLRYTINKEDPCG